MIIGITGTIGAGKGTIVEYLESKGFKHYSVRTFLQKEIERRGLPFNRDSMTEVANDIRANHGSGYIIEQLLAEAKNNPSENAVIESIRTTSEAEHLKKQGAHLWAVDSDINGRYERIVKRGTVTDDITFEKFIFDEQREFANTDPTKQNISGVMAMSDEVIRNEGTREELFAKVDTLLQREGGNA